MLLGNAPQPLPSSTPCLWRDELSLREADGEVQKLSNVLNAGHSNKRMKRQCVCVYNVPNAAQVWSGTHNDSISHVYKCKMCSADVAFCHICKKGFVWKRRQPFICEHVTTQLHQHMAMIAELERRPSEARSIPRPMSSEFPKNNCSCAKRNSKVRSVQRQLSGCSCAVHSPPAGSKLWFAEDNNVIWTFECEAHGNVAYCESCNEVIRYPRRKVAYLRKHVECEKHKVQTEILKLERKRIDTHRAAESTEQPMPGMTGQHGAGAEDVAATHHDQLHGSCNVEPCVRSPRTEVDAAHSRDDSEETELGCSTAVRQRKRKRPCDRTGRPGSAKSVGSLPVDLGPTQGRIDPSSDLSNSCRLLVSSASADFDGSFGNGVDDAQARCITPSFERPEIHFDIPAGPDALPPTREVEQRESRGVEEGQSDGGGGARSLSLASRGPSQRAALQQAGSGDSRAGRLPSSNIAEHVSRCAEELHQTNVSLLKIHSDLKQGRPVHRSLQELLSKHVIKLNRNEFLTSGVAALLADKELDSRQSGGVALQSQQSPQQESLPDPGKTNAAVALLFLTIDDVKNPHIWEGWLRTVPKDMYNIYVHSKNAALGHGIFRGRQIPTVETEWGAVSLVRAHVKLLCAAAKNKHNRWEPYRETKANALPERPISISHDKDVLASWFLLLSDSCLPMVSFASFYARLQEDFSKDSQPISAFEVHPEAVQRDQRKNLEAMMLGKSARAARQSSAAFDLMQELVAEDAVVAHSQWCLLGRRDAQVLVRARNLEQWFEAFRRMLPLRQVKAGRSLAPDELMVLSYLRRHYRQRGQPYDEDNHYANAVVTYARCCLDVSSCCCSTARAAHPQTHETPHPSLVRRCLAARSMFARKFEPGMRLPEWGALWSAGTDSVLAVAQLSMLLSRSRRSHRQRASIAQQLCELSTTSDHGSQSAEPTPAQSGPLPPPPIECPLPVQPVQTARRKENGNTFAKHGRAQELIASTFLNLHETRTGQSAGSRLCDLVNVQLTRGFMIALFTMARKEAGADLSNVDIGQTLIRKMPAVFGKCQKEAVAKAYAGILRQDEYKTRKVAWMRGTDGGRRLHKRGPHWAMFEWLCGKVKLDNVSHATSAHRKVEKRGGLPCNVHLSNVRACMPCSSDCSEPQCSNGFLDTRLLSVRNAGGKGKGLFARSRLEADRWVLRYEGQVYNAAQIKQGLSSCTYLIKVTSNCFVDGSGRAKAHRINHTHADPNCLLLTGPDREIYVKTRKIIENGEELTLNYGDEFIIDPCLCERCTANKKRARSPRARSEMESSAATVDDFVQNTPAPAEGQTSGNPSSTVLTALLVRKEGRKRMATGRLQ